MYKDGVENKYSLTDKVSMHEHGNTVNCGISYQLSNKSLFRAKLPAS